MGARAYDRVFDQALVERFVWIPELGMGHFPVDEADEPYRNGAAQEYWDKYVGYAATPLGEQLTQARVDLVRAHTTLPVVDVGIGCGAFVEAMHAAGGTAYGYDVNPVAIEWLHGRSLWRDPNAGPVSAVTLWDVLEHLPDPSRILRNVGAWAFVSIPTFADGDSVLTSRHFRPEEHRWYWTVDGLIGWMAAQGFECLEHDDRETRLGRESIETFAFRRVR